MDANVATSAVYRFGGFTLDVVRGALLASGGAEVALRPKAFALLRRLVENAGRLINRDEIMAAIWPGVIVTDDSVAQLVKEIRRALGDEEQQLLRTVPRRGLLFAADVVRAERPHTEAAAFPPGGLAAPAPACPGCTPPRPPTGRPMVVVLPFEDMGGESGQGYFADGLTTDLVTDLTRFQSLHVVCPRRNGWRPGAASPIAAWLGEGPPPPRAADYLVSGGVRRAGGRVRVSARLEDAESGVCLWAERFDRPLDDLFAVQEELATNIAAHLVSRVDQESMRRARWRPPASLDAYDLCLRGRELHARATEADTLLAREVFTRAIASDPDYSPAHAWQAYTVQRGFTHWWGEPRGADALPAALAHARRAAELEPVSPLCMACLAFILLLSGRHGEALETARRAVNLNPSSWVARLDYGIVLSHVGTAPEEGVREIRSALALDPFHSPWALYALGKALLLAGRPEEALAQLQWCTVRLPDYLPGQEAVVVAAAEAGRPKAAQAAVREVLRLGPHWTLRTIDAKWSYLRPADAERFRAAFRAAGLPAG